MKPAWVLCLLMMTTASAECAAAETIWQRAKFGNRTEERRMRVSIEKVLLGEGDDRDLLQARVGLITLSRGEIQDPRTVVLLLRMRREMGLTAARLSQDLLTQALKGDLSLTERAWAELELAHIHISQGDVTRARLSLAQSALSRGLQVAWQTQVRAETLNLRGFVGLRLGNTERALHDFSEVTLLSPLRRSIVQAHIGQALAFALRGEAHQVQVHARRAFATEATRATVSRMDPFWDLQLSPTERDCAHALLLFGRAEVLSSEDPRESHLAESQACSLLEATEPSRAESASGSESMDRVWDAELKQSLSAFYRATCERPAPAEIDEDPDQELTRDGELNSASGSHENDF